MTRMTSLLAGALVSLGTTAAHAQTIDCACASTFTVGDRVTALVDNPASSNGIAAGTRGTVICGINDSPGLDILVRWDNFSNGQPANVNSCSCALQPGESGTNADWYVACTEVALFTPVRNVTQSTAFPTIQAALDAANGGDTIEIDPVTIFEDGIVAPFGLSVTIRGAGKDQTIIDGMGAASPSLAILTLHGTSSVTISDLTFRNGRNDIIGETGAVESNGASVFIDSVQFLDNAGSHAHLYGRAGATLDCRNSSFLNAGSLDDGIRLEGETLTMVNCLVVRGTETRPIRLDIATAMLTNTTVVGPVVPIGSSTVFFTNSTSDVGIPLQFGGTLSASRSLFPGATGNNIDGTPTFVDALNGDYRLAAGSLGIDAADFSAFANAGGSLLDLGGALRLSDDPGTPNTGTGATTVLDIGAFEFQGASTPVGTCPGDADGDGETDVSDITFVVSNLGCTSN